jgi:hypothetical protein
MHLTAFLARIVPLFLLAALVGCGADAKPLLTTIPVGTYSVDLTEKEKAVVASKSAVLTEKGMTLTVNFLKGGNPAVQNLEFVNEAGKLYTVVNGTRNELRLTGDPANELNFDMGFGTPEQRVTHVLRPAKP